MGLTRQFGQLLYVDLNSSQCYLSAFPETCVEFIGGRGFNIWYLYHHLVSGINPLGPENILLLSCGLLTGSSAPTSSRLHLNALSPLTGILGSSNIGGYAGAWLRSCNIASIIVTGKSQKPVSLYIDSKGARLEDASHLWGHDTFETQEIIKQSHNDKKLKILTIGPGGEGKVKFGAIITEKDHAAGRTGMGSVMGSKNLKAIVISKGTHKHFPCITPLHKKAVKTYVSEIKKSSEFDFLSKYGGAGYVKWVNDLGVMARHNYGKIGTDRIEKIDGRKLDKNVVRPSGCFRCPVQCKAELKLKGLEKDKHFTRPEFEPLLNLGPKCGLENMTQIVKLDNLCTRLGIDSTSAASVIAFAMDLSERKILPANLVGDLDLSWGNADTMEKLIYQMVEDKGLGIILRDGVRKAAELIGNGAYKYAAHIKGLELTAYHPSAIMGTALGYAVSSRGGDYNNVYASLEYNWTKEQAKKEFGTKEAVNIKSISAKGRLIKKAVITNIIVDCLGLCKVPVLSLLKSFNLENEIRLINGLTDLDLSKKDLFDAGQRIASLEKFFNIRHEKGDIEDSLPEMFIEKNSSRGLTLQNFKAMLQEYYAAMGWDEKGIPPESAWKTNFCKLEEKK